MKTFLEDEMIHITFVRVSIFVSMDHCLPEASGLADVMRTSEEDVGVWECLMEDLQK